MNSDRRGFFKKLFGLGALAVSGQMLPAEAKPISIAEGSQVIIVNPNYHPLTFTTASTCNTINAEMVWKAYYPYEVK